MIDISKYSEFKTQALQVIAECDEVMERTDVTDGWRAGRLEGIFKKYDLL